MFHKAAKIALRIAIALALHSAPVYGESMNVFGKTADIIARMPSGRAGYDAVLVQRPNEKKPFFVLVPNH